MPRGAAAEAYCPETPLALLRSFAFRQAFNISPSISRPTGATLVPPLLWCIGLPEAVASAEGTDGSVVHCPPTHVRATRCCGCKEECVGSQTKESRHSCCSLLAVCAGQAVRHPHDVNKSNEVCYDSLSFRRGLFEHFPLACSRSCTMKLRRLREICLDASHLGL